MYCSEHDVELVYTEKGRILCPTVYDPEKHGKLITEEEFDKRFPANWSNE